MSQRLAASGSRFRSRFKTISGKFFFGQLLDIPDTSRVSNFISARRYLRTTINSGIKATDVIVAGSTTYIVANHGEGFYREKIYIHHKLFEVDTIAVWKTQTRVKDPITGLFIKSKVTQETPVYISTQPKNATLDTIHIPSQNLVAVTNVKVNKDDELNGYIVTKVDFVLGVYFIELQEV